MTTLCEVAQAYPKLFPSKNGLPFIFEHGEGWALIIARLAQRLAVLVPDAVCVQSKEKFGGLRFYTNVNVTGVAGFTALMAAEHESFVTCELCGDVGWPDGDGCHWIRTLCGKHHEERKAK